MIKLAAQVSLYIEGPRDLSLHDQSSSREEAKLG